MGQAWQAQFAGALVLRRRRPIAGEFPDTGLDPDLGDGRMDVFSTAATGPRGGQPDACSYTAGTSWAPASGWETLGAIVLASAGRIRSPGRPPGGASESGASQFLAGPRSRAPRCSRRREAWASGPISDRSPIS